MTIIIDHTTNSISPDTTTINGVSVGGLTVVDVNSIIDSSMIYKHLKLTGTPIVIQSGMTDNQMITLYNSLSYACIVATPVSFIEGGTTPYYGVSIPAKGQAVIAKVSSGESIISGKGVTGLTLPDAPTSVTVTAGVSQATVSFTPPSNNGGSSIITYTVISPGGQTTTGTSSPIVVTGLISGSSYTCTVTATTIIGTGVNSSQSSAVIIL